MSCYDYKVGDKVYILPSATTNLLGLATKIGEVIKVEPDQVKVKVENKEYWLLLTEIELYRSRWK